MADILIVDDNEITLQTVDRLLTKEGYNVVAATNGKEAIQLLNLLTFDVVISDLTMPFVTGLDLVRHIREHFPETPVIIVSSTSDERSKRDCYNLGVEHFLSKPITPMELVMKVRKLAAPEGEN